MKNARRLLGAGAMSAGAVMMLVGCGTAGPDAAAPKTADAAVRVVERMCGNTKGPSYQDSAYCQNDAR